MKYHFVKRFSDNTFAAFTAFWYAFRKTVFFNLSLTAFHFLHVLKIPIMIPGTCYLLLAPGESSFKIISSDDLTLQTLLFQIQFTEITVIHPHQLVGQQLSISLVGQCFETHHPVRRQQRYSVCVNCIHRSTKCSLAMIAMDPGLEFSWRRSRYSAWTKTQ